MSSPLVPSALPVLWLTTVERFDAVARAATLFCGLTLERGEPAPEAIRPAIPVVLDRRAFVDEAVFAACRQRATVLLLLIEPTALALEAPRVAPHEDLCSVDDPLPLIAHRLQRLIERVATTERDALTGLLSRPAFRRALDRQLPQANSRRPLSLLLLDLDHFKKINDEHGHQVGDEVLRAWARCVADCCPTRAAIARIGGEEIAVLLDSDEPEALALATLLCEELRRQPRTERQLRITVSIGVASAAEPIAGEELLRQADQALYAAKAEGRNRAVHFAELEREAFRQDEDLDLFAFENVTRVISERIAELITRRGRRLFRDLKAQADIDALTGLYARRYLDRRLAFEFGEAARRAAPLTVALLDIDHFGQVNKTHGWPSGDRVLRQLAEMLQNNVRGTDWVARYGGEEFCLVMPATSLAIAVNVLERIRLAVARFDFAATEPPLRLTISAGAACRSLQDLGPDDLIERASGQLLHAKRSGRDRVCSIEGDDKR